MRQGDAIGWTACGDEQGDYLAPRGGQAQLRAVLAAMARATPAGREPIAPGLARAIERMKTRGMVLVFTDLYEPDEALAVELRRGARMGHDVVLFHLVTRSEIEFPYDGDLEFVDLETGARVLSAAAGTAGRVPTRAGRSPRALARNGQQGTGWSTSASSLTPRLTSFFARTC